jgi:hypothetical protein
MSANWLRRAGKCLPAAYTARLPKRQKGRFKTADPSRERSPGQGDASVSLQFEKGAGPETDTAILLVFQACGEGVS